MKISHESMTFHMGKIFEFLRENLVPLFFSCLLEITLKNRRRFLYCVNVVFYSFFIVPSFTKEIKTEVCYNRWKISWCNAYHRIALLISSEPLKARRTTQTIHWSEMPRLNVNMSLKGLFKECGRMDDLTAVLRVKTKTLLCAVDW
jgi:hypothetical protein